jgi:chromosome segregation protein
MLRLERLEVVGFKSFPDKTRVDFPSGVTAVVGPNGCGKSNIADAVQWALGEQSARALRGARMEDVIFAGSSDRGPGGLAEVTLHLVAENGGLPILGDRARVSMTRRLYRTGDSEYLLDGKRSRLQDIRQLLDEVRAGVRTYAIIDQSRVGSFVVSKPRERRVFIEEAAGISGYKQRRRHAELKLEATRSNLLRVEDIVREVERQRRSLQRQASLARRARRLQEEYVALKTFWFARRWRSTTVRGADLEELLAVCRREAHHLEAERERQTGRLDEARGRLREAQSAREAIVERLHALQLDQERCSAEGQGARERAASLEEEARRREGESEQLEQDRALREREAASHAGQLEAMERDLAELEGAADRARGAVTAARDEHRAARERAAELEARLYDRMHARADLSARLSAAGEAALRESRRVEESAAAGERLSATLAEARAALGDAERELDAAGREADRLAAEARAAREAEETASAELERARAEDATVAAELGTRAGELGALDSLDVRLAGAEGAREALEHARAGRLAARHVVADLVAASPAVERAAEAYLDDLLPAVIVEETDEVLRGAELGIRGRLRFLPLDAPNGGRGPQRELPAELLADPRVTGRLAPELAAQPGVDGAVTGRLRDAVLVRDLAAALELHRRWPEWTYLTPEGHSVAASGMVSLEGPTREASDGLLARARRREALSELVETLERRRAEARGAVEAARERLAAARRARGEADEALGEARRHVAGARVKAEQAAREQRRLDREAALAGQVHEAAERGLAEARERAAELEREMAEVDGQLATAREELDQARQVAQEREEALRAAEARSADLEAERRGQGERRAAVAAQLERARRELGDLEQRSVRGAEVQRQALVEATRLRERASQLEADLVRLRDERVDLDEQVTAAGRQVEAAAATVREREAALEQAGVELEGARARREQAALEVERIRAEIEHLEESCREELEQEPGALPAERPDSVDPELFASEGRLAARLAELREKRGRLGPVNLLAEGEFEELTRRWDELTAQRDDLQATVDELTGSIRRMNRESKQRFLDAFTEIRRHFREQFATLFRGGRGDLVLEEEDDPLESGIEILCQPPGKKLQSVSLLSGGEKALAATAVLFSIFRYHPPPFCLLDEVDAPLDDANIGRFAEALRGFASRTQFILITHNKRTMELADLLYGVTMPEPGVSRLVSMTLD